MTIKIKSWELRAVPRLCELYPSICLTTYEKHGKTSAAHNNLIAGITSKPLEVIKTLATP
jgi:hypothetical protein